MSFCSSHRTFFSYGQCPDCLRAQALAMPEAGARRLKARLDHLSANPETLNQDQFGICGMTAILYLMLLHRRSAVTNLFQATFGEVIRDYNTALLQTPLLMTPLLQPLLLETALFQTARHGPQAIDLTYLLRRFTLLMIRAPVTPRAAERLSDIASGRDVIPPRVPPQPVKPEFLVDFCLARALGYLFKKVAPARYASEKLDFNATFDPIRPAASAGDYRNATRAEALALRTQNLAFILQELVGVEQLAIASSTAARNRIAPAPQVVAPLTFANEAQFRATYAAKRAFHRSFAIAAIYAQLLKKGAAGPIHVAADRPISLDYDHWACIEAYQYQPPVAGAACQRGHVQLKLWSWGTIYTITVCDEHLPSYIQDVVFGSMA